MASVRINVSLPQETFKELAKAVDPRRRSRFISGAIKEALREEKAQRLAAEYEEAGGRDSPNEPGLGGSNHQWSRSKEVMSSW